MSESALAGRAAQRPTTIRRMDNYFFSGMAVVLLITVFLGFERTYFLAGAFHAPLPNLLIHVHAVVFSSWIALLIAQTSFVSAGRVDIHRRLGLAGFGLSSLMVVIGVLAATNSLARNFSPPGSGFDPRTFYAVPILGMVMFATLIFFAFRARSNPAAHKRLILVATICLMGAPTGRPPFNVITGRPLLANIFVYFFLLVLVCYDLWSVRKVHRATIWAGLFVVIATLVSIPVGGTAVWHNFAGRAQTLSRSVYPH